MRRRARLRAACLTVAVYLPALAAAQQPPATDLWVAELARDGEAWRLGAPRNLTDRDGYDNQPAFTADGARLLYTAFHDGQTDIYELALATGTSRRVTATAESEYSPTPYGDGTRFSVVRVEADGTQRLWSFSTADGGDPRLLAPQVQGVGYHAWLDARRLALFVLGEPFTLRLLDLELGSATTVAERIGRSIHRLPGAATVSFVAPDGDADDFAIFAIDADGSHRRRLAPAPATLERDYAWTPDGVLLAAIGGKLYRLRPGVDAGWIELADLTPHGIASASRLAVAPAGDRLVFVADR
jgi:hypothetical protein